MFAPGVPKSRFAWPLKSRVIDTLCGASWRFPELEGGSWDVTSSCPLKPRRARLGGLSYSRHCSKLLSSTSSSIASSQTSQLLVGSILCLGFPPSSRKLLFPGKMVTEIYLFGDKFEENSPQISDLRMQFLDAEASLPSTTISWLVGKYFTLLLYCLLTLGNDQNKTFFGGICSLRRKYARAIAIQMLKGAKNILNEWAFGTLHYL